MKYSLPFAIISLFLLTVFICANSTVFAQGDNPRIDALPFEWTYNINNSDSKLDVITTPDGYDNFNLGIDFAEPHISQNPINPLQYFGAFNINNAWRTSDGHNWIHSSPLFGVSTNGDPVTAYDGSGRLYYEQLYGDVIGARVIYSNDNGVTWSSPVHAISGIDKCWIAADQTSGPYANYVYTIMTRNSTGQNIARSTDQGVSWTQTGTFNTSQLPGSMVAIGPNGAIDGGAVYAVLHNGSVFSATYTFYVSSDGGATWTFKSSQNFANYVGSNVNGRHSVQNMRTRPYPFIAADNSPGTYRGRFYLVYASNNPAGNGNKPDIFCRYSNDQGETWSSAITVNDDVNSQSHNQWHPSIWSDKQTGR
jgi:hypothetical protein